MNKLDALKQYKLDGLLDRIKICLSDTIWLYPTPNTLIFNNDNDFVMLTDVFFYSPSEPIGRIFLNRYVLHVDEIKSIDI